MKDYLIEVQFLYRNNVYFTELFHALEFALAAVNNPAFEPSHVSGAYGFKTEFKEFSS